MKLCTICRATVPDAVPACPACGEASWQSVAAPEPVPPTLRPPPQPAPVYPRKRGR